MEWYLDGTSAAVPAANLPRQIPMAKVLPAGPAMSDDRPYIGYYLLRHRGLTG